MRTSVDRQLRGGTRGNSRCKHVHALMPRTQLHLNGQCVNCATHLPALSAPRARKPTRPGAILEMCDNFACRTCAARRATSVFTMPKMDLLAGPFTQATAVRVKSSPDAKAIPWPTPPRAPFSAAGPYATTVAIIGSHPPSLRKNAPAPSILSSPPTMPVDGPGRSSFGPAWDRCQNE